MGSSIFFALFSTAGQALEIEGMHDSEKPFRGHLLHPNRPPLALMTHRSARFVQQGFGSEDQTAGGGDRLVAD